jgi:acetoin utilization protein AcuC
MTKLHIAYGSDYLDWRLGENHPTNPERALLATDLLIEELGEDSIEIVLPKFNEDDVDKLYTIHSPEYVDEVILDGISNDWVGENRVLGLTALKMFAGTARLVEKMLAGEVKVAFNPQGAKHHAHYDYSNGFCVFNDLAWAAKEFAKAGLKAMYIDWDAHHGDGVEELLYDTPIVTASIHDGTAYPGTGRDGHDEKNSVYNWALPRGAGDVEFGQAIDEIRELADLYKPDVILLATGADGHKTDPLASLEFDYAGYRYASQAVAEIANKYADGRVLIGGAGGYQALTHTPAIWSEVVSTIYRGVSNLTTTV